MSSILYHKVTERVRLYYYKALLKLRKKPGKTGSKSVYHAKVTGKIAHSGYPKWIKNKAREYSLETLIRRSSPGGLEVVVIGEEKRAEAFIKELWKGSKKSKIENVSVTWIVKDHGETEIGEIVENSRIGEIGENSEIGESSENSQNSDTGDNSKAQKLPPIGEIRQFEDCVLENFSHIEKENPAFWTPNRYTVKGSITNTSEIKRAAEKLGISVLSQGSLLYLWNNHQSIGYQQSQSSNITSTLRNLTDHKQYTKEILESYQIPVPKGRVCKQYPEAKEYLGKYPAGLVVKPLKGSFGQGITVGVKTEGELKKAWDHAKIYHDETMVEECFVGIDIRILVIHGKAEVAMTRLPANILGDGKHTIKELIDQKNKLRKENPRLSTALIVADRQMDAFLKTQGMSLETVPEPQKRVFLNLKGNIGSGADSINVTEFVHPDLLKMAEEAAAAMGVTDFWGVDLIVQDLRKSRDHQKCCIIEMNSRANIYNVRFPMYGSPVDAAEKLVKGQMDKKLQRKHYFTAKTRYNLKSADIPGTMGYKDIITVEENGARGFISLKMSSLFAEKTLRENRFYKKILREQGFTVVKDKPAKHFRDIKKIRRKDPGYERIVAIHSYDSKTLRITGNRELKKFYQQERSTGAKAFMLEKPRSGPGINVMLFNREAPEGAVLYQQQSLDPGVREAALTTAKKAFSAIPGVNICTMEMTADDGTYEIQRITDEIPWEALDKTTEEKVLRELSKDVIWTRGENREIGN